MKRIERKQTPLRVTQYPGGPITAAGFARVKGLTPRARELLELKGCRVLPCDNDLSIVFYPKGTTRQELYPATMEARYHILFPDGSELEEAKTINQNTVALFVKSPHEKAFLHGETRYESM